MEHNKQVLGCWGELIGRIKSEQRQKHLGHTKACSENCLGEKGMKEKAAHFALIRLLSWASGAQCTQERPLERADEEEAEQNLCSWRVPGGKTLIPQPQLSLWQRPRSTPAPSPSCQPSLLLPMRTYFTLHWASLEFSLTKLS